MSVSRMTVLCATLTRYMRRLPARAERIILLSKIQTSSENHHAYEAATLSAQPEPEAAIRLRRVPNVRNG
jgi:hypothetical protein